MINLNWRLITSLGLIGSFGYLFLDMCFSWLTLLNPDMNYGFVVFIISFIGLSIGCGLFFNSLDNIEIEEYKSQTDILNTDEDDVFIQWR